MTWLALLAPVGVGIMVGASWLLGGWRSERLTDTAAALALFHADYPDFHATDAVLAADGEGALFAGRDGSLGAVFVHGDRFVTRRLRQGDVIAYKTGNPSPDMTEFLVRPKDFTTPKLRIRLRNVDTASWRTHLDGLVRTT